MSDYVAFSSFRADTFTDKGVGPSIIAPGISPNSGIINYSFSNFERSEELESNLMTFCHQFQLDDLKPKTPSVRRILTDSQIAELDFTAEVQAAINNVLISLKGYYEAPNPVIPFHLLKYLSFTIEGASQLKKIRKISYIKSIRGQFYEEPSYINQYPVYQINEIGDIFNYQYCFPWEALDENDYLIAYTPLNIKDKYLNSFRLKLKTILSEAEDVEPLNELEVLLNLSSSVCQDNGSMNFHYLVKHKHTKFSKIRKPGKRTMVTTAPGDGRDAIINEVDDLNTIQYIEYQLEAILRNTYLKYYLVEKNEEIFYKKYEKFLEENRFFLMRDIKKEGLTKPKILLKIMLEELHSRYPEHKAFQNTNFYDGPWFQGDTTGRGHGLGMANNLTTLMQIVCFSLLVENTADTGLDIEYDMICHNDDIIIGVKCDETLLDDAINLDSIVLEKLGIILSRDKSFYSSYGGVICERYGDRIDGFHKKESYILREQLLLYTCINVTHFKSMLSSFYCKFDHKIDLEELRAFYGFEFCKEEFDMPISIGGWQRTKSLRCSFDLVYLMKHFNKRICRVYLASKLNKTIIKKRKSKKFLPPILSLFPLDVWKDVDSSVLEAFFIVSDFKAKNLFTRLKKDPMLKVRAWDDLLKQRRELYQTCSPVSFQQIAEYERQTMKNIFPIDQWIDRWVDIKIITSPLKDPYNVPCPILSALNKLKLTNDDRYNSCFWPLIAKQHDNILRAGARKDLARIVNIVPPIYSWEEEHTVLPKDPEDFQDFMLSYVSPFLMGKVFEIYGKIPILKKEYHLVKDTWDFKMTEPLMILYQQVKPNLFKTLVDIINRFNFNTDEMLMIYKSLQNVKPVRGPVFDKDEKDDLDDPDVLEYIENLRKEFHLKILTWEESWDAVANIESKGFASFDSIYFTLDETMKGIIDQAKKIFLAIEVQKFQIDAEDKGDASELIIKFKEEYPDFMDLFGFEDPSIKKDSDDEGQWGDFDPDDF